MALGESHLDPHMTSVEGAVRLSERSIGDLTAAQMANCADASPSVRPKAPSLPPLPPLPTLPISSPSKSFQLPGEAYAARLFELSATRIREPQSDGYVGWGGGGKAGREA